MVYPGNTYRGIDIVLSAGYRIDVAVQAVDGTPNTATPVSTVLCASPYQPEAGQMMTPCRMTFGGTIRVPPRAVEVRSPSDLTVIAPAGA